MRRAFVPVLLVLALPMAGAERKPLTIEDIWAVQRVGSPSLSGDGRRLAYTVSVYDPVENRMNADVWLREVVAGGSNAAPRTPGEVVAGFVPASPAREPRRLTTDMASDSAPSLSRDGKSVAFVSKRKGDTVGQLYVMSVDGGEPERVTDVPFAVQRPRWLPDGKRIAFVSHVLQGPGTAAGVDVLEETRKALQEREKRKAKAYVSESRLVRYWDRWLMEGEYPRLFVLDLSTRRVTDLLPGSTRYFELTDGSVSYDVSPDGSSIAFAANTTTPPYRSLNYDLYLVPTAGGEVRNLTPQSPGEDKGPVFSPDGRTIAYGYEKKGGGWPDRTRLALLDVATGTSTTLTETWDVSPSSWRFTSDGRQLVLTAEERARTNLYVLPLTGGTPTEVFHGGNVSSLEVGPQGAVVVSSNLTQPPELLLVSTGQARALDPSGGRNRPPGAGSVSISRLTQVNDELASRIAWGEVEDVTFKGAANEDVQMYVVHPPGFDPKKKYPLVHMVHGGPVGTFDDGFSFRWNAQAFAAPGYVVAAVNFHGSSSFGQAYVESILGAHPDKPFTDIMKATDLLLARGYIDERRLVAAGGSYGGFLVNWIAGHTTRFAALVSHAGVYSLLGQSGSDDAYGREHSYGGTPWEGLANVERWSPNRYASGFSTPMLVIHGEKDYRVPVTQGLELYGVLTAKGVPARLVVYPEENHWVLTGRNAKLWYDEVLGWFARWMR